MEGLDLSNNNSIYNKCKMSPSVSSTEDTDNSPVKDGDTPRKNKRKSSEPRKRSDFSIKRFCPDTPHTVTNEIETENGEGRYSENPPSTPETSTPSPPDNNNLPLKTPQLPVPHGLAIPGIPPGYFHPHSYPLGLPLLPLHPELMSHMVARQQQLQQLHQQTLEKQIPIMPKPTSANSKHLNFTTNNQESVSESNRDLREYSCKNDKRINQKSKKPVHSKPDSVKPPASPVTKVHSIFEIPPPPQPSHSQSSDLFGDSGSSPDESHSGGKRSRKNYKNMTRQRRVEANARERSRVHTISAAFENLRKAVPAYSHNQRLSKLAILRIACTYIMSLATLAGYDYSWDSSPPSFAECVDQCTRTIQTEGKAKRRH